MNIAFFAANWKSFMMASFVFLLVAFMLQLRNISQISRIRLSFFPLLMRFGPVFLFGLLGLIAALMSVAGFVNSAL